MNVRRATTRNPRFDAGLARTVPLIPQDAPRGAPPTYDGSYLCGPACVAMAARAHGVGAGKSDAQLILDIASLARTTARDGTQPVHLARAARKLKLRVKQRTGPVDLAWIRKQLRQGRAVVIMGAPTPLSMSHFILVTGLGSRPDSFVIHDPLEEQIQERPAGFVDRFVRHGEDYPYREGERWRWYKDWMDDRAPLLQMAVGR